MMLLFNFLGFYGLSLLCPGFFAVCVWRPPVPAESLKQTPHASISCVSLGIVSPPGPAFATECWLCRVETRPAEFP